MEGTESSRPMTDSGNGNIALAAVLCVDEEGRVSLVSDDSALNRETHREAGLFRNIEDAPVLSDGAFPDEGKRMPAAYTLEEPLAQQIRLALAEAGLGTSALRRELSKGRVVIVQISPTSYLGLTGYRRQMHTLRIDDYLFLFSPPQLNQARLAELVADLTAWCAAPEMPSVHEADSATDRPAGKGKSSNSGEARRPRHA